MVESLKNGDWDPIRIILDLDSQTDLNFEDFTPEIDAFTYKNREAIYSHKKDEYLIVSLEGAKDNDFFDLMEGFEKVVGYSPAIFYNQNEIIKSCFETRTVVFPTYEWNKKSIEARLDVLKSSSKISDLERL